MAAALGSISLPSGLSLDTARITINNTTSNPGLAVGSWQVNGFSSQVGDLVTAPATSTTLIYTGSNAANNAVLTPTNVSSAMSTGSVVSFEFRVPILGWSSNTIVSDSAATRAVGAFYNGTPTGTVGAAYNTVTYPTIVSDTHNAYVSGVFTAPVPGLYNIAASITYGGSFAANSYEGIRIEKNGATILGTISNTHNGSTISATARVVPISLNNVPLNAGDTIRIKSYTDATSPAFATTIAGTNYFSVALSQGPAQIQAATVVSLSTSKATAQSVANATWVKITAFDISADDSTGSFNATTGDWTSPAPGRYLICAAIGWSVNASGYRDLAIYKNGTAIFIGDSAASANSSTNTPTCKSVPLLTSDVINLYGNQNSGGALNTSGNAYTTYLSIIRMNGVN